MAGLYGVLGTVCEQTGSLDLMFPREHFRKAEGLIQVSAVKQTEFITTQEAADQLGFRVQHIRRLLHSGKLQGEKVGRDWIVRVESVHQFLAARRNYTLPFHNPSQKL